MIRYDLNHTDKLVDITFKNKQGNESTFKAPILASLNKTIIAPQSIDGVVEPILHAANEYMKVIDIQTQEEIYKLNLNVYETLCLYPGEMDAAQGCEFVHQLLVRIVRLKGLHMNDIYLWCNDNVPVPNTIEKIFTEAKRKLGHTKEQTYLHDEYIHLTSVGVMIKILFPVLYMLQHFASSGNNLKARRNRDTYLLQRITYSVLPSEIITSPGFLRLETFVQQSTLRQVVTPGKILNDGMTTESKLPYTTSILLLSKLALSTLFNANGKKNLASHLYSSIGQIFRVNLRTEIKQKKFTVNNGAIEHSYSEMYKDNERFFIHDQVTMVHVAKIDNLIQQYKSQINVGNVRQQYALLNKNAVIYTDVQQAICSSVLRWTVPPDSFTIMNSQLFNGCCAVASELIKERHPELALLLLSGCVTQKDKNTGKDLPIVSPMAYKEPSRISRNRLREMYPFWTVSDRIDVHNKGKLTNTKHVMHEYMSKLLEEANKVWHPVLTETNHIYFKSMVRNDRVIPLSSLNGNLIDLFLDLDNIANITTETFDSAIAGTLKI